MLAQYRWQHCNSRWQVNNHMTCAPVTNYCHRWLVIGHSLTPTDRDGILIACQGQTLINHGSTAPKMKNHKAALVLDMENTYASCTHMAGPVAENLSVSEKNTPTDNAQSVCWKTLTTWSTCHLLTLIGKSASLSGRLAEWF